MKYAAKEMKNGKWAVFTGKKYFTETVTDNKVNAQIRACEMSAQYHQEEIDKCQNAWEDLNGPKVRKCTWGDVLC